MTDTVRVIRGEQAMTYVIAAEHDDGSLLLRPESSPQAILERTPGPRGSVAADHQGLLEGQRPAPTMPVSERQPEHAMATGSAATKADRPEPSLILEIRDLSVAYGTKRAVDDVNLQIICGEIFGLLGPNGAGKTSTLSAIEGLVKPRSGTVLVDGVDIRRDPAQAKAKLGVQFRRRAFSRSSQSGRS